MIAGSVARTEDVFTLRHPDDLTLLARYGHDERRGCFVDIEVDGTAVVSYESTAEDYDVDQPTVGALAFLAEFGFLGPNEVEDAVRWLARPPCCRRREKAPRRVRRVLGILAELERAAL